MHRRRPTIALSLTAGCSATFGRGAGTSRSLFRLKPGSFPCAPGPSLGLDSVRWRFTSPESGVAVSTDAKTLSSEKREIWLTILYYCLFVVVGFRAHQWPSTLSTQFFLALH